jgi:hypothetical protein
LVLAGSGEIAAKPQECLCAGQGAPVARDLLLKLDHAKIPLGLVVLEGHPQVVEEAQDLNLTGLQPPQQVAAGERRARPRRRRPGGGGGLAACPSASSRW